jgi:uncharacterized protein YbjT (DUF2867 family)
VARVLIVGCGCRGRELAAELMAAGHAVRGTSRDAERAAALGKTGIEGVVADPDRLGTILAQLQGVTVVVWLLGNVEVEALHHERLETMLERLVDTPVRGFVYEGTAGARLVTDAGERWHIPVEIVTAADADAVERLLS